MTVANSIREYLYSLAPQECQITDYSNQHSRGRDSHFSIILVSEQFAGISRLQRHRLVNNLLQPLLHNPVHSWTLTLYSPEEWRNTPEPRTIPSCRSSNS